MHKLAQYPLMPITGDNYLIRVRAGHLEDWKSLHAACRGGLSQGEIDQLRDTLSGSCKTIVVESKYICKDYHDTYVNFYSKKFSHYQNRCVRLLFFRESISKNQWDTWWDKDVEVLNEAFIGYSVIRPTRVRSIGRTVLDPRYCRSAPGYMCLSNYKVNFYGVELTVRGFPHISQDSDVTVCAHAAVWMTLRYFSERYPIYRETYPYQITQLTTDLSEGRLVPSEGLSVFQVSEIFSRSGFFPRLYVRDRWSPPTDRGRFLRLLYSYIESGLPLVLELPEHQHAVVAIGHSPPDYSRRPPKGAKFSSDYLSGLVINDDNKMPYQLMPITKRAAKKQIGNGKVANTPSPSTQGFRSRFSMNEIGSFVVPLHEHIYLAAEDVERLTIALLAKDKTFSLHATHQAVRFEDLVIRNFLTTARAYKMRMRQKISAKRNGTGDEHQLTPPPSGVGDIYLDIAMPKFIWVCELSTQDLYKHGKILGEIIWDATAARHDNSPWIAIHYPTYMNVNERIHGGGGMPPIQLTGHQSYDLYRHNLHFSAD
jgi:hypothetical protein